MAKFIPDLLAGVVKSFSVLGGDFCYFAGVLGLQGQYGFHEPRAQRELAERDDSYLSACPSAENMTFKCHCERPGEGLCACWHAITLLTLLRYLPHIWIQNSHLIAASAIDQTP